MAVALDRLSHLGARGGVPEPHGVIAAARGDDLPIGAAGDGGHTADVALERLSHLGGRGGVPKTHGLIIVGTSWNQTNANHILE